MTPVIEKPGPSRGNPAGDGRTGNAISDRESKSLDGPEQDPAKSPAGGPGGPGPVRRLVLAGIGIACVGLGWIGTFVPGLPTVGFLLIASYCFARSCPWLERRLIRNRFFARFLHYLDGDCEMPPKARAAAIAMMWTSIAVSLLVLFLGGKANRWIVALIVLAGVAGTIAILRFRRSPRTRSV